MEHYLLGIDVGTTGTKCILYAADGRILAHAYQGYATEVSADTICEQDPEAWLDAAAAAVRQAVRESGAAERAAYALAFSAQGGTLVVTDAAFHPLRPAILWSDTRCAAERTALAGHFGPDWLYSVTGWPMEPGLNALQIAHLRANEPDIFAKARYFLSVESFLAARLTGIPFTELSDAGVSQLANVREARYEQRLLNYLGIGPEQLPVLVPAEKSAVPLTAAACRALGLSGEAWLAVGAHDQYAAALGAGLSHVGDVLIGTGTAWAVTAMQQAPDFSTGLAQSVSCVPGLWGAMASLSSGGVCLEWIRDLLAGAGGGPRISYAQLDAGAAACAEHFDGLMFFPYFGGAAWPLQNADCPAAFLGLSRSHNGYDLARAVMESISCQTAWMLDTIARSAPLREITLVGGAAKSAFWTQLTADILGRPIRLPAQSDLGCTGAALLAGLGSGVFADTTAGLRALQAPSRLIEPDARSAARCTEVSANYRQFAESLSRLYEKQDLPGKETKQHEPF